MDIQISSNFERALFDAYDRDGAAVVDLMDGPDNGFSYGELRPVAPIFFFGCRFRTGNAGLHSRSVKTPEKFCTCSAIGVHVAGRHRGQRCPDDHIGNCPSSKFPDAVEKASGTRLPSERMSTFSKRRTFDKFQIIWTRSHP